jgi:hypothetical protein
VAVKYTTDDGVEIIAGLRVFTNNARWGTVEATQFTRGRSTDPGGDYFKGWFDVVEDDDQGQPRGGTVLLDGERMSTVKTPGLR